MEAILGARPTIMDQSVIYEFTANASRFLLSAIFNQLGCHWADEALVANLHSYA